MPVQDDLLPIIRNLAKVDESEFADTAIKDFLDLSRMEHNATLSWDDLSLTQNEVHRFPIVLLTCVDIFYSRAAKAARESSKSASSFSKDGHFRTDPNTRLAESFEARYDRLVDELALERGVPDSIEVGTLVRFDPILHKKTPESMQVAPPVLTLKGMLDGTDVVIEWARSYIDDFKRYRVYRHTSSGIKDFTRDTEGASHPAIIEDATHVVDIEEQWRSAYRDESPGAGSYFYVLVLQDHNERVSVSNEVAVTVS